MKSLYGGFLIVASCRTLHYTTGLLNKTDLFVQQAQGWAEHVPLAGSGLSRSAQRVLGWEILLNRFRDEFFTDEQIYLTGTRVSTSIQQGKDCAQCAGLINKLKVEHIRSFLSIFLQQVQGVDRFNRFRDEQICSTGPRVSRSVQQVQGWANRFNRFRDEQIGSTGSGVSRSVQQINTIVTRW